MDKTNNYNYKTETIFASASGAGLSAIKVIRISGNISTKVLKLLLKKSLPKPKFFSLAKLYDLKNSSLIDKAMVVWIPGPKTYTGEDIVEIHLHGGQAVLEHLTNNLYRIPGLREAKPGEFTKRAFENNKIDLLEAEGVADLVNAETASQKKLAIQQLEGNLSKIFNNWANELSTILAHYEAQIDFPEDEVPPENLRKIMKKIKKLSEKIKLFLLDNRQGDLIRSGIQVGIIGPPNAGKSSLINQISKKNIAIVSKMSGTTRDVIETKINLSNIPVIFSDTAGLRKNHKNIIEKEGIKKTKEIIKKSDIKLFVLDINKKISKKTFEEVDNKTILILNKIDIMNKTSKNNNLNNFLPKGILVKKISALKGIGINSLLRTLVNVISKNCQNVLSGEPVLTRVRHRKALEESLKYLNMVDNKKNPELNAEDLRLSVKAMGKITGKFDIEKLLDIVFKDFCIGK